MPSPRRALAALLIATVVCGCGRVPPTPPTPLASARTPVPSSSVAARNAEVQVGPARLGGTLTRPGEGVQDHRIAVLLVWGSGPNDRDNTVGSAQNKPFKDIADGLAARGISSLRFDKRSTKEGAVVGDLTIQQEYLDDTTAAIELLQRRPETRSHALYVLGHSMGGMVLPNILDANPDVAGGVSLAGSPRSFWEVIGDQEAAKIERSLRPAAEKDSLLAESRRVHAAAAALTDPGGPPMLGYGAAYIVGYNRLRSGEVARSIDVPMLVQQGAEDRVVAADPNFRAWQQVLAGKNATFRLYPGLHHLFLTNNDASVSSHVDGRVLEDLAAWLTAR